MIKTVIFDLGGVYFTDGTNIAVEKISKRYNLPQEHVERFLRTESELGVLYRKGEITVDEFWDKVKKLARIKASNTELNKIWIESYVPISGTIDIINRLKKNGIKLYFLSDNVKERVEYLQGKYKFMRYFAGGIFSHEVHMTKKDGVNIFKLALQKTAEKTENIVFIDDKDEYVKTARKLGMIGICFKTPKQLDRKLKKLYL